MPDELETELAEEAEPNLAQTIMDANADQGEAEPAPGDPVEPEPEPDPEPEDEPEPPRKFAGRFNSEDELERGYQELLGKLSRGEHKKGNLDLSEYYPEGQAPPVEEVEPEPEEELYQPSIGWQHDPNSWEPESIDDLQKLVETNPVEAGRWVLENQDRIADPEFVRWAVNSWYARDPMGAHMALTNKTYQQQRADVFNAIQPAMHTANQSLAAATAALASQMIPEWQEYAPKIQAVVKRNEANFFSPDEMGDPTKMAQRLQRVYAEMKGMEYLERLSQEKQGTKKAPSGASKAAAMSPRNGATPAHELSDEDFAEAFRRKVFGDEES